MTDKIDATLARIVQLLAMALSGEASDGERLNALRALDRHLRSIDADSHDLIARLESPGISDDDMQKIFDAGYAQRAAEEEESRRKAVAVVDPMTVAQSVTDSGVNGYTWREIAGHCVNNLGAIRNDWEIDFIRSIGMNFVTNRNFKPSAKQMPILARIFRSWFNGAIT